MRVLQDIHIPEGSFYVFREEDVPLWHKNVSDAFPVVEGKYRLFGYDWIGNCFGISDERRTLGEVLIFEIGTGKILTTGMVFSDFVNKELIQNIESCLSLHYLREIEANGGRPPAMESVLAIKYPCS